MYVYIHIQERKKNWIYCKVYFFSEGVNFALNTSFHILV